MATQANPTTPEALLSRLTAIFPAFLGAEAEEREWWDTLSFHSVMQEFLPFFAKCAASTSPRQLSELALLLDSGMSEPGKLENAIDTCFLEHLRQVKAEKFLRRYLAQAARQRRNA